jgi:ketosteroid isomerase-like protein
MPRSVDRNVCPDPRRGSIDEQEAANAVERRDRSARCDDFAKGDVAAVLGMFADDITWHVPGRSRLSGDYRGHQEIAGFFTKAMELSGGTLRVEAEELLADGERVAVLSTVSAKRNGESWSSPEVHVWRVVDGQAVEFREYQGDQHTEDAVWG